MAIPQGSTTTNTAYFDSAKKRIEVTASCTELQELSRLVTASVNATLLAITNEINTVNSQLVDIANDVIDINATLALIAEYEASNATLEAYSLTAASVNIATVVTWVQGLGVNLNQFCLTNGLQMAKLILQLGVEVVKLNNDITRLNDKITTLTAQASEIPIKLTEFQNAVTDASLYYPDCTVSFV